MLCQNMSKILSKSRYYLFVFNKHSCNCLYLRNFDNSIEVTQPKGNLASNKTNTWHNSPFSFQMPLNPSQASVGIGFALIDTLTPEQVVSQATVWSRFSPPHPPQPAARLICVSRVQKSEIYGLVQSKRP